MYSFLFLIMTVAGFGYRDNSEVRSQVDKCMIPVETCKGKFRIEEFV